MRMHSMSNKHFGWTEIVMLLFLLLFICVVIGLGFSLIVLFYTVALKLAGLILGVFVGAFVKGYHLLVPTITK